LGALSVGVLDYTANTPPAQALGVTSAELAKLADGGYLVLLVNGWNEIPRNERRTAEIPSIS
jgi:hypothetical protein